MPSANFVDPGKVNRRPYRCLNGSQVIPTHYLPRPWDVNRRPIGQLRRYELLAEISRFGGQRGCDQADCKKWACHIGIPGC